MNPLDLRGPEFLLFYLVLIAITVAALIILRRAAESGDIPKADLADPYLIAYLRGGSNEALRVALVSLVDRGLLTVDGTLIGRAKHATPDTVRRSIEKRLLEKFQGQGEAKIIFSDMMLKEACEPYRAKLKALGLLPDASAVKARWMRFIWALLLLEGLGAVKIAVALARGRTNIEFLVILMIVAIIIAAVVSFPRLTVRGAAMLEDIKTLYAGLKERAAMIHPGGATAEAVMLAAVFGVGALAGDGFAYTQTIFPQATSSSGASSCGSSCGSSGGSSCGGGGCGGGCGGCGS